MSTLPLILASSSPRRQELLKQIGVPFEVRRPGFNEDEVSRKHAERPMTLVEVQDLAMRFAREKAQSLPDTGNPVLGADTIVTCDGTILAKPADDADAARMLGLLSG